MISSSKLTIHRHRAARPRKVISTTLKAALLDGIITKETSILDYGCGRGFDVFWLRERGYDAVGYDPYYAPNVSLDTRDVVLLGYVLNVIEDKGERDSTLIKAYKLARKSLVVSAIVQSPKSKRCGLLEYKDGFVGKWGTFEKHYLSAELQEYIEDILGTPARRLSQGVYAVQKQGIKSKPLSLETFSSTKLKVILDSLESERELLLKQFIAPVDAVLEKYFVKGHEYWKLRSRSGSLPNGKKVLYVGKKDYSQYLEALQCLERSRLFVILERRIAKVNAILREREGRGMLR